MAQVSSAPRRSHGGTRPGRERRGCTAGRLGTAAGAAVTRNPRDKAAYGVLFGIAGLWGLCFTLVESALADSSPCGELAQWNRGDLLTLGCAVALAFHTVLLGRASRTHAFEQISVMQWVTAAALAGLTLPALERSR